MITLDPRTVARNAVSQSARPATVILFDRPDVRLVVFRLRPGQSVPPHRSPSSVMLTVLDGEGWVSDASGERTCSGGDVVCYEPTEVHGMRAGDAELHLLATITPRPGERPFVTPERRGDA